MSLDKKYGVPPETIKSMVRDGVISCSVLRHHEIYDIYCNYIAHGHGHGKTLSAIFFDIAQQCGVSDATVKQVVYNLGKKS